MVSCPFVRKGVEGQKPTKWCTVSRMPALYAGKGDGPAEDVLDGG